MALLSVQVVHKVLSPIMVGTLSKPVIISNLFIALFHSYSIYKIVITEKQASNHVFFLSDLITL